MTAIRELLALATRRLTAADVGSPRVDAELLLAFAMGLPRGRLAAADEPGAEIEDRYAALIERRCAREPLQHITGTAPFRHLDIAVGPGVFVPRPETELLLDAVLDHLEGRDPLVTRTAPVVVDLCAGSGALALAAADELPGARVLAVERDPAALEWLARNTAETAVEIVPGDVTDPDLLADLHGCVDAVVSNPPYVPLATTVAAEVHADPPQAVFAGDDGLEVLVAVVARAAELLRPGGLLAVEHDETHVDTVPVLFGDADWDSVVCRADLAGRARYTVAIRRATGA